tara:strand:+ start:858 stop:1040 length:183 start_codon:yes stop_codon:yes gene_type:complete
MYKSKSIHQLMNNYLNNHTLSNAWLVLNYVRKYPTALSGLNRIELAIYKAIVVNCGEEIR